MKRLLLASAAVLAMGILANAQNITRSLQVSQDPTSGYGISTPNSLYLPNKLHTNNARTPTLGNCGSGQITGTGFAGIVDEGSGSVTTCTVTFPEAYNATPYCVASSNSTTTPVAVSTSPNGFLATHVASAALLRWMYICVGARAGQQ